MSFLQPIALFGIALAATPILIHLLNLMRHRRESWAAMRFLIKKPKKTPPVCPKFEDGSLFSPESWQSVP